MDKTDVILALMGPLNWFLNTPKLGPPKHEAPKLGGAKNTKYTE